MSKTLPKLIVLPSLEAVSHAAAERFADLAQGRDLFTVALSGGSTPRRLYQVLARSPYRERISWELVHVFWGDERCVPPDDPASSYRMACESLLDHVPIPASNIHRVLGELEPQAAARAYTQELRDFFGTLWPRFDLILLGMGNDGHTASLFPGSDSLRQTAYPVVGVTAYYQDRPALRVTLTPPVINAARQVIFLVSGADKAETLQAVLKGPYQPDLLPAQIVQPVNGDLVWLADAEAAAQVRHGI